MEIQIWTSLGLETLEKNKCELGSQPKWSVSKDLEKQDMIMFNAWNSILDSYDQLKKLAFAVLSLFGSTYSCEKSLSRMNLIKSKLRSRLINENQEICPTNNDLQTWPDFQRRCKDIIILLFIWITYFQIIFYQC